MLLPLVVSFEVGLSTHGGRSGGKYFKSTISNRFSTKVSDAKFSTETSSVLKLTEISKLRGFCYCDIQFLLLKRLCQLARQKWLRLQSHKFKALTVT